MILAFVMMLIPIHIFADEDTPLKFNFDGVKDVTISGRLEPNALVFLQVLYLKDGLPVPHLTSSDFENGIVYFVDSAIANELGDYEINVKMRDISGTYVFRVNSKAGNQIYEHVFDFHSQASVIAALNEAIQNKDSAQLAATIEAENPALEPDAVYYQKTRDQGLFREVCEELVKMGTVADKEDFQQKFFHAVLLTYFNKTDDGNALKTVLSDCAAAAGYTDQNFYQAYSSALGADAAAKVIQNLLAAAPYQTLEQFTSECKRRVILDGVRYSVWGTVQQILEKTGADISDHINVKYQALKKNYPGYYANVAKSLAGKDAYDLDALAVKWSQAIDEAIAAATANQSSGGSSGSHGGSSSGGGLSSGSGSSSGSSGKTGDMYAPVSGEDRPLLSQFDDLDDVAWAVESINGLVEKDIIKGKTPRLFYPNDLITRAEYLTLLVRAYGLEQEGAKCTFEDVPKGAWFHDTVASAYVLGLTQGVSEDSFGAEEPIKREDLCVLAYKAMLLTGVALDNGISAGMKFSDGEDIDDYAREAVDTLCGLGVVNGMGDGRFAPFETATRAQAAKIIYAVLGITEGEV